MTPTKFFKQLFGSDSINFRIIKGKNTKQESGNFDDQMVEKLNQWNKKNFNIYFVVNSGGYSSVDITQINSVFIDFDCGKDQNGDYHPTNVVQQFKAAKLQVIDDFELKPTAIIETRNGFHVYWFVQSTATVEQFKECTARLISYFQSDPNVVRPCNLLRAPGFYWCKDVENKFFCEIVRLNDVRYQIEDVIDALPEVVVTKQGSELSVLTRDYINTKVSCKDGKTPSHKELIEAQDISALQSLLNPSAITFNNYGDIYRHLRQQDLSKFLGIPTKNFNCLFHDENNPSANIYTDPNTGYYWYKCFSCGIVRDIISITEKWLKCSTPQALRFLRQVYNISFEETEWQREQKEILEENKRLLYDHERLSQLAPETYKRVKNYIPELIILNDFASNHVVTQNFTDDNGNALFYVIMKQMARSIGYKDTRRLRERISHFAYLGLVNKLRDDQIPGFLLDEAAVYAKANNHQFRRAFYSIPSYCEKNLTFSESKATRWMKSNYTMEGFSRELILRNEGKEEADRVYPQMSHKQITPFNEKVAREIEEIICRIVFKEKGWTTQSEVLEQLNLRFRGAKKYKDVQLKRCLNEILDKYGLKRIRLNKELKSHFGIAFIGYPFIILQNDVVTKYQSRYSMDTRNKTISSKNIVQPKGGEYLED
ncbi:CHC2 zinc finger domain-containing protein [Desulfosporosinus sp. SYSU MS00001]|uniref:CHC2 zinc finger domain-containing protein n=1 Tax=Desulfosporosinus sp. SYSU MS00001 TaxID=3416284 RepID=UPI003CF3F1C9